MLKEHALQVLQTLEKHGFEAYYVGGCVRDWLLGRPVHDIDICTNAHPGDVMRLFPEHVPTGLQHGTVSVKIGSFLFEVTTFRTEGEYEDFRRPSNVQFVSDLVTDLERRDFTINAMAMDSRDQLADPFHGQEDLNNRLIRAVGVPAKRFREDALRLLRAARFAAQLHFDIESDTLQAMTVTATLLDRIAVERVRDELNKLIDSATPERGCDIVVDTRLLGCFPLLDRLFETARPHVWRLVHLGTLSQKWALLCYAAAFSKEQARAVCQLLRMSKRETEEISRFVELMAELSPQWDHPHPIDWSRNLLHYGWSVCMEVDNLLQACWWKNRDRQSSVSLIAVYEAMPVKTVKELAVNGKDLQIALQKKAGEWIQHVLMYLLEQTALHQLPNTPEALVEAARKEVVRYEHQARNT
ncbi:CCA tRNA nucleotidyltransferase [Brevibacillus sp. H7]|uniref:CCA tRNA nucleotidyltransferase n=1 Tax=Brevibacillus sp. H7 TaxID=3349138 RepID=UPI00382788FD